MIIPISRYVMTRRTESEILLYKYRFNAVVHKNMLTSSIAGSLFTSDRNDDDPDEVINEMLSEIGNLEEIISFER